MLTLTILGFTLLGVGFGFYFYRELSRYVARARHKHGICGSCGKEVYVTLCERCRLSFGMCHSYSILGTNSPDPAKLRPRRASAICEVCLSEDERAILERILNGGS